MCRAVALSLAVIVAFLGIAVFSSLHKHQGAANRCSLNGFDQLMTGEAEQAFVIDASSALDWHEVRAALPLSAHAEVRSLFLRGPPAAL